MTTDGLAITGIPSNFRVPGQYAEILFGQGPSTSSAGAREIVFVMPMTSAGAWTAATLYEIGNEQQVITGAGAGSPLHRAYRAAIAVNKNAKYWAVPYAETSGSAASADVDVTWTNTTTAAGVTTVWVCGERCDYAFPSGETVTNLAAGMKASINAKTWLPVTADNSSGVLTITAKIAGASQGNGTIGQYQIRAAITAMPGTATTVALQGGGLTAEVGDTVAGAEGSTTEATNFAAALAVLDSVRKYYIAVALSDATNLGVLKTHITTKSLPASGLRSVGVAAYTHTKAGVQTIATGLNYERIRIHHGVNLESDNAEIVGEMCGRYQLGEELDSASGFDLTRLNIKPAFLTSDWPDATDLNDEINDGIAPIASDSNGSTLVMSVTTRSKDASGTVDDFSASEPHRISVADEYTDVVLANDRKSFTNKKLQRDQFLPDGRTVNINADLPANTTTPHYYKNNFVKSEIQRFAPGKFQEVAAMLASVRVVQDPNNSGRLEVGHDMHVVDIRHQATWRLAEVSPG